MTTTTFAPFSPSLPAAISAALPIACFAGFRFPQDLAHVFETLAVTVASSTAKPCVNVASDDALSYLLSPSRPSAAERLAAEPASWLSIESVLSTMLGVLPGFSLAGSSSVPSSCDATSCTFQVSPYAQACVRLCASSSSGDFKVSAVAATDQNTIALLFLGLLVVLIAPLVTATRQFYYISAGMLGAILSIGIVVYLLATRTDRLSTPYRVSLAAGFQLASLSLKSMILRFIADHVELFIVYVLFFFGAALALVHQKMPDSGPPSSKVVDVFSVLLECAGLGIVLLAFASFKVGCCATAICLFLARAIRFGVFDYVLARMRSSPMPKPRRLQTLEEYEELGKVQTEKALEAHLKSPEFVRWMTANWHRVRVESDGSDGAIDQDYADESNEDDDDAEEEDQAVLYHGGESDEDDDDDEEEEVENDDGN